MWKLKQVVNLMIWKEISLHSTVMWDIVERVSEPDGAYSTRTHFRRKQIINFSEIYRCFVIPYQRFIVFDWLDYGLLTD